MVRLELRPEHPSSDLFEALDKPLWEALATGAAENVIIRRVGAAEMDRLREMGLAYASGRPTAAGYALLLSWHRKAAARARVGRWRWLRPLSRHEIRMRELWGC